MTAGRKLGALAILAVAGLAACAGQRHERVGRVVVDPDAVGQTYVLDANFGGRVARGEPMAVPAANEAKAEPKLVANDEDRIVIVESATR